MAETGTPNLLIAGIAEGFGIELAKTFAMSGYNVSGLSRTIRVRDECHEIVSAAGRNYSHILCDLSDHDSIANAFADGVQYDVVIYNAHTLLIEPFGKITPGEFEKVWRTVCFGAMQVAHFTLPPMLSRKKGTLIFSGATASIRGTGSFSAFSSAKFALRGLAQSLAREYSPKEIHVAHVILDGLIDEPQSDLRFGIEVDTRMKPEEIAQTYLNIASQKRTAWTHELDLRPFTEKF